MILAGHGILHAGAEAELQAFAEKIDAPVAWTLLGVGALDERHPLAYGFMGMHGWKHVNRAIQIGRPAVRRSGCASTTG